MTDQQQTTTHAGDGALAGARLSFVGAGTMAEAMLAGLLRRGLVAPAQVTGSHPRANRREELNARYGVRLLESNREAAEGADLVVLAVKPQRAARVLEELKGACGEGQLILSIVAGLRAATIVEELGHAAVVRAMPNTPAQIGRGITAWTPTARVTEAQSAAVRALLGALGREMQVENENMIDMATALSATGPTYIFMMMEALVDAGVHMGFSRHVSQELVAETMLGSVLFAMESHKHPAELRNMVTSPGGTSAEAIYQMEKGGLRTVLSKAVYAAYQRAVALGRK
ncbi:MAG TPA: pyrroline-5-carboxylate reductase [Pyrinomonadaceae bacterium]|jgi:pyrroline-5-carboxylate reductase|nr:pyrroline-5-carboxylate reductase [Pyrinomonadaceae bacterium]